MTLSGTLKRNLILGTLLALLAAIPGVLWTASQKSRDRMLAQAADRALSEAGLGVRLGARLSDWGIRGAYTLSGARFSIQKSPGTAIVGSFLVHGSAVAFVAYAPKDTEPLVLIPLSGHSKELLQRAPPSLLAVYRQRLELALRAPKAEGSRP